MKYRWSNDIENLCKGSSIRFDYIKKFLTARGIPFNIMEIGSLNHIFLSFGSARSDRATKIFTAHYDTYETLLPGANDNGAAVLELLYFAEDLMHNPPYTKIIILFTDGEELKKDQNLSTQGSYALASRIGKEGLGEKELIFFAFDMCGVGDCPVWCISGVSQALTSQIEQVIDSASAVSGRRVPFLLSDNIGFMLNKNPVVTISFLPEEEAEEFSEQIKEKIERLGAKAGLQEQLETFMETLPPAWETMHSDKDTPEKLENKTFGLVRRLLKNLALI